MRNGSFPKYGDPNIEPPKYHIPYYKDPQNGSPNFREPPYEARRLPSAWECHMSYSLNSLKGVTYGIIYGTIIGVIKGDTRSLDYSSYR